jgi:predicted Fe-Mo cluster-binding NifX family protein
MLEGKVAIPAGGSTLESEVLVHFGVTPYFIIYDPATKKWEAAENPGAKLESSRGITAAEFLIGKGVKHVITVLIGPKPFETLTSHGVKLHPGVKLSVQQVIESIEKGNLQMPLKASTEPAHLGKEGGC